MSERLEKVNLTLNSVVKVDVMLRDVWDIPVMEKVFKQRLKEIILRERLFPRNLHTKAVLMGLKFKLMR
ncbi:hypothetical protein [Paenibacillus segetis]|uniref:Uncharacterized protein n=1 Tax=Paenibacillus segetis TaxID=1325360 RepID=A0ABQ1YQM8_9BACL|nr:hypothetical protein [Paenibacillus segetis]GGH34809.1 hypothetical protein GCM10008013_40790 [Paenibacillus segetis]